MSNGRFPRGAIARFLCFVTVLAGLTLALAAAAGSSARFRIVEGEVVRNADFAAGAAGWAVRGPGVRFATSEPPVLILDAGAAARPAFVGQSVRIDRDRYDHVRVSVELRASALRPGAARWERGQLQLASYDRRLRLLRYWPRRIASLEGSHDWRRHVATLPVSHDAHVMWLGLYAAARSGLMMARDLQVSGVVERPWSTAARRALAFGWLAAWAWAAALHLRRRRCTPAQLAAFALASVLLVAGVAPQPHFARALSNIESAPAAVLAGLERWRTPAREAPLAGSPPRPGGSSEATGEPRPAAKDVPAPAAERAGRAAEPGAPTGGTATGTASPVGSDHGRHFTAFALLAVTTAFAYRRSRPAAYAAALLGLSAAIQIMQSLIATRESDLVDLGYDALGIAVGVTLVLLAGAVAGGLGPRATFKA